MRDTDGLVKIAESRAIFGTARTTKRPITWSMTAKAAPQETSEFESVLLAIAGHDLRQPLQVIQGAHDFLGLGIRTESELRLLRSGQSAIDRLKDQLDQLLAAIRLREHAEGVKLTPFRLAPCFDKLVTSMRLRPYEKGLAFGASRQPPRYRATSCFSAPSCATWLATLSNTQNLADGFSWVAVTSAIAFVSTSMTLESASRRNKCLEFSMLSLASTRRDAMV
jgi:signal transduction histidine kinase